VVTPAFLIPLQRRNPRINTGPSSVVENSACKILWDFSLTADKPICHNRPDIVVLDKHIGVGSGGAMAPPILATHLRPA